MRNYFQALLISTLLAGSVLAAAPAPSARLQKLVANLPAVGKTVEYKQLGLGIAISPTPARPATQSTPTYVFTLPADLDRRSTDEPPYAGKYPGLHLNLPMQVQPSYINYLFISDQPERITDERQRDWSDPARKPAAEPGATGIYARSTIPPKATTRVLVDHTNGTSRKLRFRLVFIPDKAGSLSVRKRAVSVHKDSVTAGGRSFSDQSLIVVEPRVELQPDAAHLLVDQELKPEETVVVHMEYFASPGGQLAAVVSELEQAAPNQVAALDQLPVLHSIVWNEEAERLTKFIDPKTDPTRFNRIKNTFQHARGHFQFPDRQASVRYSVDSWNESQSPLQVYSLFESIPGVDGTVNGGATTDNRGKYGARNGLKIQIDKLPPDCREMALLVFNRTGPYGGRHWVSDGKRTANETIFKPGNMLARGQLSCLWRGRVSPGTTLTLWTEPMANTSVNLWYLLVPIPPAGKS